MTDYLLNEKIDKTQMTDYFFLNMLIWYMQEQVKVNVLEIYQ